MQLRRVTTHRRLAALTIGLLLAALPAAASAQMPETSPAHQLLNAKCTRCHSAERVLKADPGQLKGIVERMQRKSPDLFPDTDNPALIESLSKILNDPKVVAGRVAWNASVARGMALFNDASLGTNGKSCGSCHRPEDFKGAADRYPALDVKLGRLVSLQERLQMMIQAQLGGAALPLGDPRTVDLEAYVKSLQ
jgi:cytochrome c553